MGYFLNVDQVDHLLDLLSEKYDIYAPKRFPKQGRYSDTDFVRYDKIRHFDEIVWNQKSDLPAKEVVSPIQESIFYFAGNTYTETDEPERERLVFAHPCDINAQRIQSYIFLHNGAVQDPYYKRSLDKTHFVMMECMDDDDTCFCVSMGQNKVDEGYDFACAFHDEGLEVSEVSEVLKPYFQEFMDDHDYHFSFVEENALKVQVPGAINPEVNLRLKKHPMWKEYNSRCISCGACTVCCPTCTCFQTRDNVWNENHHIGERVRVYHSCQVPGYDTMAGQREIRNRPSMRMRYKVLHKIRDFKLLFGENMCVGCGRCIHRCPSLISIAATYEKVNKAVGEIEAEIASEQALSAQGGDQ